MNNTLLSLLTGLVSGAITAVVTYFATLSKARLDLTIQYDKVLHENRLAAYTALWPLLKPLAPYSPEKPITYHIVKDTSEKMRDWYFDVGGIFLSSESRGPYFDLKDDMKKIIDDPVLKGETDRPLDEELLKPLHRHGRALREALSNDIGTRRRPFV